MNKHLNRQDGKTDWKDVISYKLTYKHNVILTKISPELFWSMKNKV